MSCGLVIQRCVQAGRKRSLASRKLGAVAFLSCAGSPVAWHFRQGAAVLVKSCASHADFGGGQRFKLLRNEGLGLDGRWPQRTGPASESRRSKDRTWACGLAGSCARRRDWCPWWERRVGQEALQPFRIDARSFTGQDRREADLVLALIHGQIHQDRSLADIDLVAAHAVVFRDDPPALLNGGALVRRACTCNRAEE